jgi:hypothetical protein
LTVGLRLPAQTAQWHDSKIVSDLSANVERPVLAEAV